MKIFDINRFREDRATKVRIEDYVILCDFSSWSQYTQRIAKTNLKKIHEWLKNLRIPLEELLSSVFRKGKKGEELKIF